jgi:hypothetical protein
MHRWEDNIKIDIRETELGDMGCIDMVQDRGQWWALVNMVINFRVPYNVGKFLNS